MDGRHLIALFLGGCLASWAAPAVAGGAYFVALDVPERLRPSMARAQLRLRASGARIRWSPAGELHLTLRFCGELAAPRLEAIRGLLRRVAADHAPFLLHYRGVGTFAHRHRPGPRVLWARPTGQLNALAALASDLARRCEAMGGRRDDFPFRPHVTLGRAGWIPPGGGLARAIASLGNFDMGRHRVKRFVLFRSNGEGSRSHYEVVETFPLGFRGGLAAAVTI